MSKQIRYAVWAAVSTTEQAGNDKYSLSNQIATSRERAKSKGWIESAGPYLVPGSSRSMWVDLTAAAEAIPSLGQLLEDARAHSFDVLVFSEYDRFRDLVDLVGMALNHYGIQLYSTSQPSEPLQPDVYNPYASDAEPILRDVSKIASRIAINNMRRKYLENMPERVRSLGLNAISIPYGYQKPTDVAGIDRKKAVAVQNPATAPFVVEMKDLFLAGQSLRQIRDHLSAVGALTPRGKGIWHGRVIRDILTNPFYAGVVRFGVSRVTHDLMDSKRQHRDRNPDASRLVIAPGKHTPLWDMETHESILAELRSRPRNYRGQVAQRLTGMLTCHACNARLHMHYRYLKGCDNNTITWRCSVSGAQHVTVADEIILDNVVNALVAEIDRPDEVPTANDESPAKLADLQVRKKRIIDAYEAGVLDLSEYANRVKTINSEISMLETHARDAAGQQSALIQRAQMVAELRARRGELRAFILEDDQQEVNHLLRTIFDEIKIDRDGNVISARVKTQV